MHTASILFVCYVVRTKFLDDDYVHVNTDKVEVLVSLECCKVMRCLSIKKVRISFHLFQIFSSYSLSYSII